MKSLLMMEENNLSSPLAKRDKKEKYIIYLVGAALLFVLVGLKEISQSNPYLSAPAWFCFLATNTSYLFTAYTRKKIDEYEYFLNKVFSIISKYDQSESIKNYLFTKVTYSTFKRLN